MIGSDYMNDNAIHPVFPNKRDEIETLKLNIEILKDFIDDTVDEIGDRLGYKDELYKLVDRMRYELADKLH
jgi:hypothetical protein